MPLPIILAALSANDPDVAILLMMPAFFLLSLPFGAAPAAVQEMTPRRLRGQASALYLLATSVFSYGIGPTVVAMLTQYVFRDNAAVGQSLMWTCALSLLLSATLLLTARGAYRSSIRAALA